MQYQNILIRDLEDGIMTLMMTLDLTTIMWLSLRVFLPLIIANPTNTITINYFAFLQIVPLILNLGTIILCLQLLTIFIDYLIINRESILLKSNKKSRITNPKLIVSLLSIIIVLVLVPIIFFIPDLTINIFSEDFFSTGHNLFQYYKGYLPSDRSPLFIFNPIDKSFYFSPKSSFFDESEDCIINLYSHYTPYWETYGSGKDIVQCIDNLSIVALDLDPIKRELILVLANSSSFDLVFSIGVIKLANKDVNIPTLNSNIKNIDLDIIDNLNASFINDIDLNPNNNRLYILHDKKITEVDMDTKKIINSSNLETISKKFVIDFYNKKIFLLNPRGLDIISMDTTKRLSHINLQEIGKGEDIDYDYNNRKLYLSVINYLYKSSIYIVEPSLFQVINKLEIEGYPLNIGFMNDFNDFNDLESTINNKILLLTKGPTGIREYGIDELGDIRTDNFIPIHDSP